MIGIYVIINRINGHTYIGQSNNIERRWTEHHSQYKNKDNVLSRAIKKYGFENFELYILEECRIEELNDKEKYWIAKLKPDYNMNNGGSGNGGRILDLQLRQKFSEIGKQVWANYSDEFKTFVINNNLKGRQIGYHQKEETKQKLREKTIAYFQEIGGMPQETKDKIAKANSVVMKGNKNGNKKVTQINKTTGETIKVFESVRIAANSFNIHPSNISAVCNGRQKSAGGYYWKFCD